MGKAQLRGDDIRVREGKGKCFLIRVRELKTPPVRRGGRSSRTRLTYTRRVVLYVVKSGDCQFKVVCPQRVGFVEAFLWVRVLKQMSLLGTLDEWQRGSRDAGAPLGQPTKEWNEQARSRFLQTTVQNSSG